MRPPALPVWRVFRTPVGLVHALCLLLAVPACCWGIEQAARAGYVTGAVFAGLILLVHVAHAAIVLMRYDGVLALQTRTLAEHNSHLQHIDAAAEVIVSSLVAALVLIALLVGGGLDALSFGCLLGGALLCVTTHALRLVFFCRYQRSPGVRVAQARAVAARLVDTDSAAGADHR